MIPLKFGSIWLDLICFDSIQAVSGRFGPVILDSVGVALFGLVGVIRFSSVFLTPGKIVYGSNTFDLHAPVVTAFMHLV